MTTPLRLASETWYVYALAPRQSYYDVTLPVTTFMASKRSERGPEHYERAWKRYLLAQQAVKTHPSHTGVRHGEPRVVYDPVRDDVYWLFRQDNGRSFVVTPRLMPELAELVLDDEAALPVPVRAPSYLRAGEDEDGDEERAG